MATGIVKFFNRAKNFWFIRKEGSTDDIFVHGTQVPGLEDWTVTLDEGNVVEFEVGEGRKGPEAKNVKKISEGEMSQAA